MTLIRTYVIQISPSVSTPAQSDPVGEETVIVPEVPAEDVTAPAQSDAQMGDEPTTVSEVQPEATMNQVRFHDCSTNSLFFPATLLICLFILNLLFDSHLLQK